MQKTVPSNYGQECCWKEGIGTWQNIVRTTDVKFTTIHPCKHNLQFIAKSLSSLQLSTTTIHLANEAIQLFISTKITNPNFSNQLFVQFLWYSYFYEGFIRCQQIGVWDMVDLDSNFFPNLVTAFYFRHNMGSRNMHVV